MFIIIINNNNNTNIIIVASIPRIRFFGESRIRVRSLMYGQFSNFMFVFAA